MPLVQQHRGGRRGRRPLAGTLALLAGGLVVVDPATAADPPTLLTDQWLILFEEGLVDGVCRPGAYFRECFVVSAGECAAAAAAATENCIAELAGDMPAEVSQEDAAEWGDLLARCVGLALEQGLAPQRLDAPGCLPEPAAD